MLPRRSRTAALVLLLAATLAGCGGQDSDAPTPSPPSSDGTTASPSATATVTTPSDGDTSASTSPSTAPAQGTPSEPVALEPVTALLDWSPLPGRVIDTVTTNGTWTLTLDQSMRTAVLTDGDTRLRLASGQGRSFGDAFLDDAYAVLVAQDDAEGAPAVATVVDLADGGRWRIDGTGAVPTTSGGSWALAGSRLLHPTRRGDAYCLASVDLATRTSTVGYCAAPRSGFNSPLISRAGTGLLTFDDSQPSCRTAVTLDGAAATPLPGVPDCSAWQGLPTPEGAVWSTIPKPRRVEHAEYFAHSGDSWFYLGSGVSGTLTWCGDSAFFSRDPDDAADPARLMRWDGERLTVAYEAPAGQSFIAPPRCAGAQLNLSVLAEGGDAQVVATVG